jgi:hypothetical protein
MRKLGSVILCLTIHSSSCWPRRILTFIEPTVSKTERTDGPFLHSIRSCSFCETKLKMKCGLQHQINAAAQSTIPCPSLFHRAPSIRRIVQGRLHTEANSSASIGCASTNPPTAAASSSSVRQCAIAILSTAQDISVTLNRLRTLYLKVSSTSGNR